MGRVTSESTRHAQPRRAGTCVSVAHTLKKTWTISLRAVSVSGGSSCCGEGVLDVRMPERIFPVYGGSGKVPSKAFPSFCSLIAFLSTPSRSARYCVILRKSSAVTLSQGLPCAVLSLLLLLLLFGVQMLCEWPPSFSTRRRHSSGVSIKELKGYGDSKSFFFFQI